MNKINDAINTEIHLQEILLRNRKAALTILDKSNKNYADLYPDIKSSFTEIHLQEILLRNRKAALNILDKSNKNYVDRYPDIKSNFILKNISFKKPRRKTYFVL